MNCYTGHMFIPVPAMILLRIFWHDVSDVQNVHDVNGHVICSLVGLKQLLASILPTDSIVDTTSLYGTKEKGCHNGVGKFMHYRDPILGMLRADLGGGNVFNIRPH